MSKPRLTDTIRVLGRNEQGHLVATRRRETETGCEVSLGHIGPVVEGQPLSGSAELVEIRPIEETNELYECRSIYNPKTDGPAQVATPAYRSGWDRTFDKSKAN